MSSTPLPEFLDQYHVTGAMRYASPASLSTFDPILIPA